MATQRETRLTYQKFVNEGGLNELARVYSDPRNARVLLASIEYPAARIPNWPQGGRPRCADWVTWSADDHA